MKAIKVSVLVISVGLIIVSGLAFRDCLSMQGAAEMYSSHIARYYGPHGERIYLSEEQEDELFQLSYSSAERLRTRAAVLVSLGALGLLTVVALHVSGRRRHRHREGGSYDRES